MEKWYLSNANTTIVLEPWCKNWTEYTFNRSYDPSYPTYSSSKCWDSNSNGLSDPEISCTLTNLCFKKPDDSNIDIDLNVARRFQKSDCECWNSAYSCILWIPTNTWRDSFNTASTWKCVREWTTEWVSCTKYDENLPLPTCWSTANTCLVGRVSGSNWSDNWDCQNWAHIINCNTPIYTCSAWTYLPKNQTTCEICPAWYYCPGWSRDNNTFDKGKYSCPSSIETYTDSNQNQTCTNNGWTVTGNCTGPTSCTFTCTIEKTSNIWAALESQCYANTSSNSSSCKNGIPTMKCSQSWIWDTNGYQQWICTFSYKTCNSAYYEAQVLGLNNVLKGSWFGPYRSTNWAWDRRETDPWETHLAGFTCKYCQWTSCIEGKFNANNECTPVQ